MFRILLIFLFISLIIPLNSIVNSGPMVGYSTKSEVALWIQTKKSSKVSSTQPTIGSTFELSLGTFLFRSTDPFI